jgi:glycosyltransferase involved in cell wall biosynthesis
MHISYWAPFFDKIATVKSVKNSIKSLLLFYKNPKNIDLINFFGEWSNNKIENVDDKDLNYINFYNKKIINFLPKNSFIKSRFSYLVLFFLGIYPLIKYLKKNKPDYLLVHLISSLPLIILILFNFKTQIILRVSGLPKLTLFRKLIWKFSNKKIFKVFVPTQATLDTLKKNKIFDENKLFLLRDPIIEIKTIKQNLKKKSLKLNNFFLSIGRLTKQKNHKLLLNAFKEIYKKNKDYKLVILGEGELKKQLINLSKELGISSAVYFMGNVDNVYEYISKSICVISTSLWEDPGFVMIETAITKKIIISSDCPNGPKEFIENNKAGYIFKNDDVNQLINQINLFLEDSNDNIYLKKLAAIKKSKKFTLFNHYCSLKKNIK